MWYNNFGYSIAFTNKISKETDFEQNISFIEYVEQILETDLIKWELRSNSLNKINFCAIYYVQ